MGEINHLVQFCSRILHLKRQKHACLNMLSSLKMVVPILRPLNNFLFFSMFRSLHDKSEQPFEILIPAFQLWGFSQPVGHPESGKNCFLTLERNVMVRGCLWEHRSLSWYSLFRKSENYCGYKWNRAILSPWQSFISYSYLLTDVMGEGRWLMSLCHHWYSYKGPIELQHVACLACDVALLRPGFGGNCGMVQLQELKLCSLVTSSSRNFFLTLANLLFLIFSSEVRRTPLSSVLKIGGCTREVFFIPCSKRSNKNVWININSCKCMYISTHFWKWNYAKPGL